MTAKYEDLLKKVHEVAMLGSSASILGWDQETMMPPAGVGHRALQLAQLARMTHEMGTSPEIGDLISECETEDSLKDHPDAPAVLRELRREYDRATKLPSDLVAERSKAASMAQHHWQQARAEDDFSLFEPHLKLNLDLARQAADCYGWPDGGEPWDALAEGFEPGMNASGVAEIFNPLRTRLQSLLDDILGGTPPSNAFNEIVLPIEEQKTFVRNIAADIGFDFERGRLDVSAHPFCGGSNSTDVRMTTRYRDNGIADALSAVMHESGHGIYEQGLPADRFGSPLGSVASLGMHESQSRLWENQVGRSATFWKWCHPKLADHFGRAAGGLSFDDCYGSANQVAPSLIRVEADEATYNMHIMIRFDLERDLVAGSLNLADVPEAWNAQYKNYLGIDVPDARNGCLQDIHWAFGGFGYFPTYTLGNLYCAQLFEAACRDINGLVEGFANGKFKELKAWLNENIHAHGARYSAKELCERVTGEPLSADALLRHLSDKLRPLYKVG